MLCGFQHPSYEMKQERARAACGIEDTAIQWIRVHVLDHALCKPIRRIIFTQLLALLRCNDGLIEDLQHIVLDVPPRKPGEAPREASRKCLTLCGFKNPVKEVLFDYV